MADYTDRFYQGILDELAEAQAQADATMREMGIEPPDPKLDTVKATVQSHCIDNMDSGCLISAESGHSAAHTVDPIDFEALVNEIISQWDTPGGYPEIEPVDLSDVIDWVKAGCQ